MTMGEAISAAPRRIEPMRFGHVSTPSTQAPVVGPEGDGVEEQDRRAEAGREPAFRREERQDVEEGGINEHERGKAQGDSRKEPADGCARDAEDDDDAIDHC